MKAIMKLPGLAIEIVILEVFFWLGAGYGVASLAFSGGRRWGQRRFEREAEMARALKAERDAEVVDS